MYCIGQGNKNLASRHLDPGKRLISILEDCHWA